MAADEKQIRVCVVDDHPIARAGLEALLQAAGDFAIVGVLASGEELLDQYPALTPDVTVIDLRLSGIDGIETIRRIRSQFVNACFLMMTSFDGDENVYRAIEAGASGYLLKDSLRHEVFDAIRQAAKGRKHFSGAIANQLAANLPRVELTQREMEVLQQMSSGMRNKEIASVLNIAEHTVKVHVQSILNKLNVNDRTEAVVTAYRRGFIRLN
jgi:DNA-binding NarL/FixJ family response regulator